MGFGDNGPSGQFVTSLVITELGHAQEIVQIRLQHLEGLIALAMRLKQNHATSQTVQVENTFHKSYLRLLRIFFEVLIKCSNENLLMFRFIDLSKDIEISV